MKGVRGGFSLVELMVVVVILSVAAAVATLGLQDVSDEARARAVAEQLGSVVRLARVGAALSGRPCVVRFDSRGCCVARPARTEDAWRWVDGPRVEFVPKVVVEGVSVEAGSLRAGDDLRAGGDARVGGGSWSLPIPPTWDLDRVWFRLRSDDGRARVAIVSGLRGSVEVRVVEGDER